MLTYIDHKHGGFGDCWGLVMHARCSILRKGGLARERDIDERWMNTKFLLLKPEIRHRLSLRIQAGGDCTGFLVLLRAVGWWL